MFSFGDHGKERIESNHAIHFLYGHVQFAGDDTLHLFRLVPDEFESRQGNINDFSSIRFMRMFLTGFKKPIVLLSLIHI